MDAAADYSAAKAMLNHSLPAYVSYTVRSHLKFDAAEHDVTENIVVRTRDGVIVKGKIPESPPNSIHIGSGDETGNMEPVEHPAFKVGCYEGSGARLGSYDGTEREAIALRDICGKKKGDQDFDTLYVDQVTHQPVAAVGTAGDEHVDVRLVQEFSRVQDRVLPSSLYIRIHGTGLMFWLDLLVDQRYENYRFSSTP